ncbi:MAG TPA: Dam family site-specific DNA-(adenine-N6)-methyltransferase, partial [Verrucomicrobiae bacterium]|nr:Dam family site-specific DNA-(adenine-N6)-methyltransferase [Verrucomicrobiae bacterium]
MSRNVILPRPFLKWAGGKTQLLDRFERLYPGGPIPRYVEPFVGSGAVFFHVARILQPRDVVLADGNEELINAYEVIQGDVERLIRTLSRHKRDHSEAHYYEVREQAPSILGKVARAARLIYLNKTCFNGLYRVNSRGQFNVP